MGFKFNPEKNVGEVTNLARAMSAKGIIKGSYEDGEREDVIDLIADLLHYSDFRGFHSEYIIETAISHWREER